MSKPAPNNTCIAEPKPYEIVQAFLHHTNIKEDNRFCLGCPYSSGEGEKIFPAECSKRLWNDLYNLVISLQVTETAYRQVSYVLTGKRNASPHECLAGIELARTQAANATLALEHPMICGFDSMELIALAMALRKNGIRPEDLSSYISTTKTLLQTLHESIDESLRNTMRKFLLEQKEDHQ